MKVIMYVFTLIIIISTIGMLKLRLYCPQGLDRCAICTLTRGYPRIEQYDMLIRRNASIERSLKNKSIQLVIIHEGNITPIQQDYIKRQTPSLQFIFKTIEFDKSRENVRIDDNTKAFNMGYRHMCSFWFVDMWNTEIFREFDYILRIDEDCEMHSNIDNVFKRLIKAKRHTAICASMDKDWAGVTKKMNDTTLSFLERRGSSRQERKNPGGPMTQLIGFNLKALRKNVLLHDYVSHVHSSKMIYINRWGDLPLWGEVYHYLLPNQLLVDKSIKYFHASHVEFSHNGKINYK